MCTPASIWQISPISSPRLTWGAIRNGHAHQCPVCHIPLLTGEKPGFCCGPSGVKFHDVPALPPLPQEYNSFINDPNISSKSRLLNLIFSFAAMETTHQFPTVEGAHGFVAIQGKVYHRVRPSHQASIIRWLLHDGFLQNLGNNHSWTSSVPEQWRQAFLAALSRVNPLVQALRNLSQISPQIPSAQLIVEDTGAATEIAAIMSYANTTQQQRKSRRLVISTTGGNVHRIATVSRLWEPLAYPLLFPHGTLGWGLTDSAEPELDLGEGSTATQMWHYRARLLREPRFQIFGRLANEYLVDMFSRDLEARLDYIRRNQLRIQEEDAELMGDDDVEPTENIYLPSSFLASKRWSSEQIADSLTIASHLGNPTFFITMTCNPEWPEITSQLRPGQDYTDIPIIVVRVFKQKVSLLLKLLKTMFPNAGRMLYCIHCIEFQKRGLPHAHILVKYEKSCTLPSEIDAVVSAEMPSDPVAAAIVKRFMVHNHPAGSPLPRYCQRVRRDGTTGCRFRYPRSLQNETTFDNEGRVSYRRRKPGDEMVVPHCLPALTKFECHMNWEIAGSTHLFQYLFKYLHKGPDSATYRVRDIKAVQQIVDEIEEFWNARYLSSGEAAWRIMGFHITKKEPSVTALPVHLPGSRRQQQYSRSDGSESKMSLLDRYFHRPLGSFFHNDQHRTFNSLTYLEYYRLFRLAKWNAAKDGEAGYFTEAMNMMDSPFMHVVLRTNTARHLTRIRPARPSDGEVYYLHCILQNQPVTSFLDARTVNGVTFETFQDAAKELGLFSDHSESTLTMMEAVAALRTPRQIRYLFVDLLVNDCIDFPRSAWEEFEVHLSQDFVLQHSNNEDLGANYALEEIQQFLTEHGKSLADYGLPGPDLPCSETAAEMERWGSNPDMLRHRAEVAYQVFNNAQKQIFDLIWDAVQEARPLCLFIDGKAGTGKTTIVNVLCDALRAVGRIVLPTATSAFAAQLYHGGRTTHSTFKISVVENNELISSSVLPHDSRAQLIRDAALITWDEAPMTNKAVLACMEEVCHHAMRSQEPFGGKVVVLLGDFRQTCPVVRFGTKSQVIDVSIKSSRLWLNFNVMRLTQLIRNADDLEFAHFVNAIGDHAGPDVDLAMLHMANSREDLINFVFPQNIVELPHLCLKRSILAPTNQQVDEYNREVMDRLPGAWRRYHATDSLRESNQTEGNIIPESSILDYVAKHPPIGIPPSQLTIKVGGVYRIMRNFSIDRGLVKNTRVVVTDVGTRLITVQILNEDGIQTENILLPRITFTSTLPSKHTLVRRQFPLAPAYATTFTSCQGLTLDKIGADLTRAAFSHGQLYTALSRVRNRNDAMVLLPAGEVKTRNVTFFELL